VSVSISTSISVPVSMSTSVSVSVPMYISVSMCVHPCVCACVRVCVCQVITLATHLTCNWRAMLKSHDSVGEDEGGAARIKDGEGGACGGAKEGGGSEESLSGEEMSERAAQVLVTGECHIEEYI